MEVEVGVVEVVEVVEGDIDIVDLVEATTPVVEVVSENVLEHIPFRIVKTYYRTRAIISRGLYFFTHFSLRLRLILQTIYALNKEMWA